jgi:hypothetical protein
MPVCKLCLHERELRNSHIVPEFLYDPLYNGKHQMLGVTGIGSRGAALLQKSAREHLFCESCEQHFNEHFEKPFRRQWVEKCPLLDPWLTDDVHWIKVEDYASFKLFHLSVLFRAGVSTLPMFAEVKLGLHEKRIRSLLLSRSSGRPEQYPIFGYAIVCPDTSRVVQCVSKAEASSFGGRPCYAMIYGGVQWWVRVTSSRHAEFENIALRVDGSMALASIPWHEISILQEASRALQTGA